LGKSVLALIRDNARWHTSKAVRTWVREHNRTIKRMGKGVRIWVCFLPVKSPWLNPIEPKLTHGKRRIVEPNVTLSKHALADRIYATFDCPRLEHISIPEKVS
jgi:transposase